MILSLQKDGETTTEYIKRILEDYIVNLKLKPGEKINETELSELFEVSRTPVREALLELKRDNLVEIFPHKGIYVSLINFEIVEETRFLRKIIEKELVIKSCDLYDQEFVDKMNENIVLQKYYEDKNHDKLKDLDDEFHEQFFILCNKKYLHDLVKKASSHYNRLRKLSLNIKSSKKIRVEHEKILAAIIDKNQELASKILDEHIDSTLDDKDLLIKKYPNYISNL